MIAGHKLHAVSENRTPNYRVVVQFSRQAQKGNKKTMTDRTHRTEIKIETHEITVIRLGTLHTRKSLEQIVETTDVRAYSEIAAIEPDECVTGEQQHEALNELSKENNNEV